MGKLWYLARQTRRATPASTVWHGGGQMNAPLDAYASSGPLRRALSSGQPGPGH